MRDASYIRHTQYMGDEVKLCEACKKVPIRASKVYWARYCSVACRDHANYVRSKDARDKRRKAKMVPAQ